MKLQDFWPQSLRYKMLLFTLVLVTVPMLLVGYAVKLKAEEALMAEKQAKLFGIASLLDDHLGEGFTAILRQHGAEQADRTTKIKILNEVLQEYTDRAAASSEGVGAGYYSRELDAIITYGPSSKYVDKVGVSIALEHPGRLVMASGEPQLQIGPLVRGNIMNAMTPIVRNGETIGYIWTNELTDDIRVQLARMDYHVYASVGFGIIVSLVLILGLTRQFVEDVETIKSGLDEMHFNLKRPIPEMKGEIGEIATAINQMGQSLLAIRTLNENILHSIADGVITVNTRGEITSINQAAICLTGFVPAEISGRLYKDVFPEGEHFHSLLLDTLETGTNHIGVETDYPVKHRNIHISISTSRLRNSEEKIIGAVVVFKDLTEQHRLQEQVIRAERLAALGELMAGVAHEIRNPLTSIKGFMQYLQHADSEEERQVYMPVIVKEVDRINRVIEELLYFARPCRKNYRHINLNEVLQETLILVQNRSTQHNVDFHVDLAEGLPAIWADAEQVKQVLLNLLINAVQSMEGRGVIRIVTDHPEEELVSVAIQDTGCGIHAADLEKIFDPFFTTKANGTGLGLPMVQRIVQHHGGQVLVRSAEGQGTTVTLYLPLRQHEEAGDEQQI